MTVKETAGAWFPDPRALFFPTLTWGPCQSPVQPRRGAAIKSQHRSPQRETGHHSASRAPAAMHHSRQNRPSGHQRSDLSNVALRRNPAGICNAEVLPNCLCAARSSSRRGSRIMTCCPSLPAAATTGAAGGWAGAGATASGAPGDPAPCSPAKELQPMAATAANDANPAASFQRYTAALAATAASGRSICAATGAPSGSRPCRGSCANCSRTRITMERVPCWCWANSGERRTSPTKW